MSSNKTSSLVLIARQNNINVHTVRLIHDTEMSIWKFQNNKIKLINIDLKVLLVFSN